MALSCCLNTDFTNTGCIEGAIGGVNPETYFINWRDVVSVTRESGANSCEAIVKAIVFCASKCMYRVDAIDYTVSFKEETVAPNPNRGRKLTLQLSVSRVSCDVENLLNVLGAGKFIIIVRDNNGIYRIGGIKNGFQLETSTTESGTKTDDPFKTDIVLTSSEKYYLGGWNMFLAGTIGDPMETRLLATKVLLDSYLCNPTSAGCGCEGN